jgi:ribose transport system ATP-binding protein
LEDKIEVRMRNISKEFDGVQALSNVDFTIKGGEIHALVGENGAGKSTLVKILSGAITASKGTISINGKVHNITSPRVSRDLGISVIYQEFVLARHLTVAENIFLDRLTDNKLGVINWKKLFREADELLKKLGFDDIKSNQKVASLSVAYQQVVEICKSLSRNAKVLVLDEPSAVLTFSEIEKLFELLRGLKQQGIAIVYISHRLNEIFELCDTVTILKDGCLVGDFDVKSLDKKSLVDKMVGREFSTMFPKRDAEIGEVVLRVQNLNAGRLVNNVSFSVRKGEVLGFAGLVGAGRTETMRALFGIDRVDSGVIYYKGNKTSFKQPYQAVKKKFGFLPEDRKLQGVLFNRTIRENTTLSSLKKVAIFGILQHKKEKEFTKAILQKLAAKYNKVDDKVSSLSGGNQQKVALAKWLAADCDLIVLDEPTRGVDVGAKTEIYKNINYLAKQGVAIIMISSEMEEVTNFCDRVIVMRHGSIVGELNVGEMTEQNIARLSMGVK